MTSARRKWTMGDTRSKHRFTDRMELDLTIWRSVVQRATLGFQAWAQSTTLHCKVVSHWLGQYSEWFPVTKRQPSTGTCWSDTEKSINQEWMGPPRQNRSNSSHSPDRISLPPTSCWDWTHLPLNKMAAVSQTTFSNTFQGFFMDVITYT